MLQKAPSLSSVSSSLQDRSSDISFVTSDESRTSNDESSQLSFAWFPLISISPNPFLILLLFMNEILKEKEEFLLLKYNILYKIRPFSYSVSRK